MKFWKVRLVGAAVIFSSIAIGQVENQDTYVGSAIESCEDLLSKVQPFIDSLPADTLNAISSIKQLITLLEEKDCRQSKEYGNVLDAWLAYDPNSFDAYRKKHPAMNLEEIIDQLVIILNRIKDPELKNEYQYQIAYTRYNAGLYYAAYTSAMECEGKYKKDGLYIAAQCVACTAPDCGYTTFERKCNYLYAAQLADQAGRTNTAETYRSIAPNAGDCIGKNEAISIVLACWGVTVSPCN